MSLCFQYLAPPPPQLNPQIGTLMNNGARDVSNNDIQKLQQQLQDIKEQVIYLIGFYLICKFECIVDRLCVPFAWIASKVCHLIIL